MSRNPLYQFVDTDTTKLEAALVDAYEAIVGHSAQPSSPSTIRASNSLPSQVPSRSHKVVSMQTSF